MHMRQVAAAGSQLLLTRARYWNGTHWDTVESTLTEDNMLEAETTHFSTWTVLELVEDAEPPEEQPAEPNYLLYGGAALLIIAVAMYLLYTRRT